MDLKKTILTSFLIIINSYNINWIKKIEDNKFFASIVVGGSIASYFIYKELKKYENEIITLKNTNNKLLMKKTRT